MSRRLSLFAVLIPLCACTGSAPSPEEIIASLQDATAIATSIENPQDISIEETQRSVSKWEWKAVHAGAIYACNADDRLRLPDCSRVSEVQGG